MPAPNPDACANCNGIGWLRYDVPVGDPNFGKLIRCDCRHMQVIASMRAVSGMSEIEQGRRLADISSLDRPGTAQTIEACIQFLGMPYRWLTIWGGSGNAKSLALQATVNELIDRNIPAVYVTAFDMISHIKEAFNQDHSVKSDSAYGRLIKFETVAVLAIDELDKIKFTEFVREYLTDLFDRRYRGMMDGKLGTLIAMNSDPVGLDAHIYSRITEGVETDSGNMIVFNGDPDIRPFIQGQMDGGRQ